MAAAGVEAIEANLAQLRKRKLELTKELRRAEKKPKTVQSLASLLGELGTDPKVDQPGFVLPRDLAQHKDAKDVLAIYQLSGHCSATTASWVLGQGRLKSKLDDSSAETRHSVAAGVEWLYILSPLDHLESHVEAVQDKMDGFGRYIVEYRLFHWLVGHNCKGIKPKARQVVAEAARSVPAGMPLCDQDKLRKFFLADTRLLRKWIESFRQRWGVKLGALPAGDVLESSVLREKVAWILRISFSSGNRQSLN